MIELLACICEELAGVVTSLEMRALHMACSPEEGSGPPELYGECNAYHLLALTDRQAGVQYGHTVFLPRSLALNGEAAVWRLIGQDIRAKLEAYMEGAVA